MRFGNWLLRWGAAGLAAAVSALFASTISENTLATYVLVALSIGCVLVETNAIGWARRLGDDRAGVGLCYALLALACIYTAGMQLGFFGNVLMAPGAADRGHASTLASAEKRVDELTQRRGWMAKPAGTTASLAKLVASYEAKPDPKAPPKTRKQIEADADALRQARADLALAQGADELDGDIAKARADVARLKGEAPKDVKATVFSWATFGMLKSDSVTNFFIVLAVLLMQFGQIALGTITGAHRRSAVKLAPRSLDELVDVIVEEKNRRELAAPTSPPALPELPADPVPAIEVQTPPPVPMHAQAAPLRPVSARVHPRRPAKAVTRQRRGADALPPFDLPMNPAANVVKMPPRPVGLRDRLRKVG